jgi:uncharacterized protein YjbI with pentapeptide repeats
MTAEGTATAIEMSIHRGRETELEFGELLESLAEAVLTEAVLTEAVLTEAVLTEAVLPLGTSRVISAEVSIAVATAAVWEGEAL